MTAADVDTLVVSVAEAAVMLGVSDDVVYRMLDERQLPELPRYSRRRLIPRAAVVGIVDQALADFDASRTAS